MFLGIPLKDEHNHEPTVQARQHGVNGGNGVGVTSTHLTLTPLEIGMYVLLAGFCFAIVVFVVSCVVYASRFKAGAGGGPLAPSSGGPALPAQNAHDWVWMGRSTLHVTDNPMFHGNSFQNPNHIDLPSQSHQW